MRYDQLVKEIKSKEDWHCVHPHLLRVVCIFLERHISPPSVWKVGVWGDSGFGMYRDFLDRQQAVAAFDMVSDFTTQDTLSSMGFIVSTD